MDFVKSRALGLILEALFLIIMLTDSILAEPYRVQYTCAVLLCGLAMWRFYKQYYYALLSYKAHLDIEKQYLQVAESLYQELLYPENKKEDIVHAYNQFKEYKRVSEDLKRDLGGSVSDLR